MISEIINSLINEDFNGQIIKTEEQALELIKKYTFSSFDNEKAFREHLLNTAFGDEEKVIATMEALKKGDLVTIKKIEQEIKDFQQKIFDEAYAEMSVDENSATVSFFCTETKE